MAPEATPDGPFAAVLARVEAGGEAYTLHAHQPTRTIDQARAGLTLDVERIVKTIAFGLRGGGLALAALRGTRRVEYAKLAALLGLTRRDLETLPPEQVALRLGVEPGGVSPLIPADALVLLDEDALAIRPTLYLGSGRPDRTLELAPEALLRLLAGQGARVGAFSRPNVHTPPLAAAGPS